MHIRRPLTLWDEISREESQGSEIINIWDTNYGLRDKKSDAVKNFQVLLWFRDLTLGVRFYNSKSLLSPYPTYSHIEHVVGYLMYLEFMKKKVYLLD